MLGDVALHEDRAGVRVEAGGEQADRRLERSPAEVVGVVLGGQAVQVDHAVETLRLVLVHRPLPQRAEIVADVERTGGLNAREDSCHRSMIGEQCRAAQHRPNPPKASTESRRSGDILALMAYEVRTDVYEGPFDVLLRLITEQRVELYDVRLSDIVDGFLTEIDQLERVDLESATEFLLIAAILVELKSRRLLPDRDGTISDEDLALLEERDYLLARLVECTTFSAAGRRLAEIEKDASRSYPRLAGPDERFEGIAPDLLAGLTLEQLRRAAERALAERPKPVIDVEHVLVDEVTVAEVVERLIGALPGSCPISFRQLTEHATSRIEIVVHFLGVLELYKQGLVELDQVATFGELIVSWVGAGEGEGDGDDVMSDLVSSAYFSGNLADLEYRG